MKKNVVISIIVALVFGGLGFLGGMQYQKSQQPTFFRQFQGDGQRFSTSGNQQNRIRMGIGQVIGEISNQDSDSITVKLQDGSSKIVLLSEKTTVYKTNEATKNDLKVGEKIAVFGTPNSDGSVTAQNIQLNPIQRVINMGTRPSGISQQ